MAAPRVSALFDKSVDPTGMTRRPPPDFTRARWLRTSEAALRQLRTLLSSPTDQRSDQNQDFILPHALAPKYTNRVAPHIVRDALVINDSNYDEPNMGFSFADLRLYIRNCYFHVSLIAIREAMPGFRLDDAMEAAAVGIARLLVSCPRVAVVYLLLDGRLEPVAYHQGEFNPSAAETFIDKLNDETSWLRSRGDRLRRVRVHRAWPTNTGAMLTSCRFDADATCDCLVEDYALAFTHYRHMQHMPGAGRVRPYEYIYPITEFARLRRHPYQ